MNAQWHLLCFLGLSTADEFLYELKFESERMKSQLDSAVAVSMVNKDQVDPKSGIVTLIFSIVFAPNKPIRYMCAIELSKKQNWILISSDKHLNN